jgi:molybdopterin-guanine dinucleotide biosynthesis protein
MAPLGPAEAVGFVVAGGESRRMGRDKALLPWGGSTLLDHAIARLQVTCRSVRILSGPVVRYADRGWPVDVDVEPGRGPLGALLSALLRLEAGAGLLLAVDLPYVTTAVLARMIEAADGWDAAVPVGPAGPEPLCAVYGAACLEPVRQRVARGDLKMTSFWPDVRVRELRRDDLADLGRFEELFRNLNQPADYDDPGP